MSYIDSRRHEHLGFLADLPIYHPQDFYTDTDDFVAGPQDLVLGGGSGEHPGAVLKPVACAVGLVANLLILMDELADPNTEDVLMELGRLASFGIHRDGLEALETALYASYTVGEGADFSAWSGLNWHRFVNRATSWGRRPYDEEDRDVTQIETWIMESLGEYMLVCRPAMLFNQEALRPHREAIEAVSRYYARVPAYANVMQLPTGYECYGRGETFGKPNMAH